MPVLGIGLLSSQAGHLIAYQARFGAAAHSLQSTGAHGYFPGVVKVSVGVACMLALTGLFAIGLARVLSGRPVRRGSAPQYLRLLAALYTLQLACFAGQETAEALVAGLPASSVASLLLWGTLGQLPVALVAAAELCLLLTRFESAVALIRFAVAARPMTLDPVWAVLAVQATPEHEHVVAPVARTSPAKRGPPSSLRLSFS